MLRKKFQGNTWRLMIGVGAVAHEGEYQDFYYPEGAVDTDTSTWGTFTFSE